MPSPIARVAFALVLAAALASARIVKLPSGGVHIEAEVTSLSGDVQMSTAELPRPTCDASTAGRLRHEPADGLYACIDFNGQFLWQKIVTDSMLGQAETDTVRASLNAHLTPLIRWRTGPSLINPRNGVAVASFDGKLWALGGGNSQEEYRSTEYLVSESDGFTPGPSLQNNRYASAVVSTSQALYVISGGDSEFSTTMDVLFADATDFVLRTGISQGRRGPCAVELSDGRILLIGGQIESLSFTPTTEIYDPNEGPEGTWSPGPDLITGRRSASCGVIDDTVYVCSGVGGNTITTCEKLPPPYSTWESAGSCAVAESQAYVSTGSRMYMFGGIDGLNSMNSVYVLNNFEETLVFRNMPMSFGFGGGAFHDGKFYLVGGDTSPNPRDTLVGEGVF